MFVEELYEKNPESIKRELSIILRNRPQHADCFEVAQTNADGIVFKSIRTCDYDYILVGDFQISNITGTDVSNPSVQNKEWRRFMVKMCGQEYFDALMRERARQKKSFNEKHDKETKEMLYDLSRYSNCDIGHNR